MRLATPQEAQRLNKEHGSEGGVWRMSETGTPSRIAGGPSRTLADYRNNPDRTLGNIGGGIGTDHNLGPSPQPGQQTAPTQEIRGSMSQGPSGINFSEMSNSVGPAFNESRSQIQNTYGGLLNDVQGAFSGAKRNVQRQSDQLQGTINTAYSDAQDYLPHLYQQRLQPQMQQGMNQLASRGMIDSSVAGTAMGQVNRNISQDILGQQAAMEQARAQALQQAGGDTLSALANLESQRGQAVTGMAGRQQGLLGQLEQQQASMTPEMKMREYEMLANMLPTLIQNSIPG